MEKLKTLAELVNECGNVARASLKLNVTRQTVDRWRTGKFKPSMAQIELAKMKGVDLTRHLVIPTVQTKA